MGTCLVISAEFIPIKVVSEIKPLLFLSFIELLNSVNIFLSNIFFMFLRSPEEKLVIIQQKLVVV